ncbi:hypothetical protein [Bowmanella denitrificans]|uniref:hypothetical protein n=1 Tax=Bowmanella denitrificans TaxID=366582 RepID=UPI0011AFC9D9|nr:hypothetical protein [Bowmanella denitrificans]
MDTLRTFSNREWNLMATLVLDLAIAALYFSKLASLPEGLAAPGSALAGIIVQVIIVACIGAALLFGLINWRTGNREPADERDRLIEGKGNSIGYGVLVGAILLMIGHLVADALGVGSDTLPVALSTPLICAHALLICLLAASTVKHLSQLVMYRRGI